MSAMVMSVALGNKPWPIDFRCALKATRIVRQCTMSQRARLRHVPFMTARRPRRSDYLSGGFDILIHVE